MRSRLRELDLLRFLAAAAVLLHHYTGVRYYTPWGDARRYFPGLSKVTDYGYLGVQLFFVISGFVILMSAWERKPGDFAASRFTRLFPAYWTSVLLTLAVFLTTGLSSDYPVSKIGPVERLLPNMTMLQTGVGAPDAEAVYWTLWVEIHFYVLFGVLLFLGKPSYRRCLIFMAGWLLAAAFAMETGQRLLMAMLVPLNAPYFVAGMALFLIYRYGANLILGLYLTACWALGVYYGIRWVSPFVNQPAYDPYVIPAVVTVIFLVMLLVATDKLRWLRWRGLTVLGALTYPLYLVHETVSRPIIKALRGEVNAYVIVGFCTAVALAAAFIIYRFVEVPAARLLRSGLSRALGQVRADLPRPRAADPEPRRREEERRGVPLESLLEHSDS